jgi:hypothetical protein
MFPPPPGIFLLPDTDLSGNELGEEGVTERGEGAGLLFSDNDLMKQRLGDFPEGI